MLPQLRLPDDPASLRASKVALDKEGFDTVLWGGVVSRGNAIGPAMAELSYYHFGERDAPGRPSRDRSLDTIGARLIAEPRTGKLDYELEGMYQDRPHQRRAHPRCRAPERQRELRPCRDRL